MRDGGHQFVGPAEPAPVDAAVRREEATPRATPPVAGRAVAIAIALTVLAGVGMAFYVLRPEPRIPRQPGVVSSVAILPFKPIVAAQRDKALELAMADALITRLSHIPGVEVRPTSAIRRYSASDQDPLAAARELGVESVLDGGIHRNGSRIRVTVRLLRASDGKTIWTDQFDVTTGDLIDVQDHVAEGVARAIGF